MDIDPQLPNGQQTQPVIAGLENVAGHGIVDDRDIVEQVLLKHFGLEESLEDFINVATAASDEAGRVGKHALTGSAMRQAHNKGAEELNRVLARRNGWRPVREGQLHYHYNQEKNIAILYQNVDQAGRREASPKNLSRKGFETERLLLTPQYHTLPIFAPMAEIWFLCASFNKDESDPDLKVELSMPKPFTDFFSGFYARLMLHQENDPVSNKHTHNHGVPLDDSFDSELGDLDFDLRTG